MKVNTNSVATTELVTAIQLIVTDVLAVTVAGTDARTEELLEHLRHVARLLHELHL